MPGQPGLGIMDDRAANERLANSVRSFSGWLAEHDRTEQHREPARLRPPLARASLGAHLAPLPQPCVTKSSIPGATSDSLPTNRLPQSPITDIYDYFVKPNRMNMPFHRVFHG